MTRREDRLLQSRRLTGALVKLLLASVYCWAISHLLLELVGLPSDPVFHGLIILSTMLVLAALTWQRFSLLVFSGSWLVLLMFAIFNQDNLRQPLADEALNIGIWLSMAIDHLLYNNEYPMLNPELLAVVICLILAGIFYLTLARFNWPLLSLTILLSLTFIHQTRFPDGLIWAAPAALVVIAAFARDQQHSYRELRWAKFPAQANFMLEALPLGAISLTMAVAVSLVFPATAWYSPRLLMRIENTANDIGYRLGLNSDDQDQEGWFSIAIHGFNPQGSRLGGPAILTDDPVMYVTGYPEAMLLRGSTSTIYDGFRWKREPDITFYRFDDNQFDWQRDVAFDLTRPDYEKYVMFNADLAINIEYSIKPANRYLTNLFLAGRPVSFDIENQSERIQYNLESLLFLDPPLTPDENATIRSVLLRENHPDFSDLSDQIKTETLRSGNNIDYLPFDYLQIPDLPEYSEDGSITSLVSSLSAGQHSDWQRALAIKDYLTDNFYYNLKVPLPPADAEFVSWFLQAGEGYCVYFATAMTMMCRSANIPARYVEGYAAPFTDDRQSSRLITGRYAHAWTEVYLSGIGWVAIDATPGGSDAAQTTTPAPIGETTPTPDSNPLTPGEEPPVTGQPTLEPKPEPMDPENPFLKNISPKWLFLLLLIPLFYIFWSVRRYWRWQDPAWLAKRFPNGRRLIIHYWLDIRDILRQLHFSPEPWETPRMFLERAIIQTEWFYGRHPSAWNMLNGVEKALYSPTQPDADELDAAYSLHLIMEKTLRQDKNRLLFLMRQICYHRQKREVDKIHADHQ